MNSLIFRKGFKDWKTTYRVDIGFEYTADLEKRLTEILLHDIDSNRRIAVPWTIFRTYLNGGRDSLYADESGLTIRAVDDGIIVSDSRFLALHIHGDQLDAIRRAAKNVEENISSSVERILSGFSSRRPST